MELAQIYLYSTLHWGSLGWVVSRVHTIFQTCPPNKKIIRFNIYKDPSKLKLAKFR